MSSPGGAASFVAPLPFRLSYTTFGYSALSIEAASLRVGFSLANMGAVKAAEVWQLYLAFPPSAAEPPRVLRRFGKVVVKPGGSVSVTATLAKADLSIWDESTHGWNVVSGQFGIQIGSSSRDIRLSGRLVL